jgi:mannose-6-phosphate isomerase-like protein (cupin superfamily)
MYTYGMSDNPSLYEEKRPWGSFKQLTKNTLSTVKIISIDPGQTLSLQSHNNRAEFWHVLEGSGKFEIDGLIKEVRSSDEAEVPIGAKHRMSAGDSGMKVLEISSGDFDENDIVRYEDVYGRI